MTEPKWMIRARSYLGTKETAGAKHNREILKWFEDSGHGWVKEDETAWCAAFVNAMLKSAGIKGTGSVAARSFVDWGKKLDKPVPGCVAVFWRVKRDGWQGHVAFFVSETKTMVRVLGGNQANSVSIADYPKTRLLGYRWPVTVPAVKPVPKPAPAPAPVQVADYTKGDIRGVQQRLLDHGYVQVGGIDGLIGDNTRGAIRDFRAKNGLPEGDHIDGQLIEAMSRSDVVRPVIEPDRANATLSDLRDKDSEIVKGTDWQKVGTAGAAAGTAVKPVSDILTDSGEEVSGFVDTLTPFQSFIAFFSEGAWVEWIWVPVLIIVAIVGWKAFAIARARLRDHRLNNTAIVNLRRAGE